MPTIKIIYSLDSFRGVGIKKANKKVGGTDHQKLKLKQSKEKVSRNRSIEAERGKTDVR